MKFRRFDMFEWSTMALCMALSASVGAIVQALKLPVYLDMIGGVLAAVILGPAAAAIVAIGGQILLTMLTGPNTLAYTGTAIGVALVAAFLPRLGFAQKVLPTILGGLLLGVVSAVLSAPVTTGLFGGVSLVGADALTAFFKATGNTLATSVLLGGLSTDPVDKVAVSLICLAIVRALPLRLRTRFPRLGQQPPG